jgi:hypothetical protein
VCESSAERLTVFRRAFGTLREASDGSGERPKLPSFSRREANRFSTGRSRCEDEETHVAKYYKLRIYDYGFRAFSTAFFVAATTTKFYNSYSKSRERIACFARRIRTS